MAIFVLLTKVKIKAGSEVKKRFELWQIHCIHYFALFNKFTVKALMDLGSNVNEI